MGRALARSGVLSLAVIAACVVNATMGLLYVWSLFLVPLESALAVSRSALSLAPALALVCFTIGMAIHDHLLRRLPLAVYTLIAFALAGGGHLLFAGLPHYGTLLAGYGVCFGLGSGLGYGLALALVSSAPPGVRTLAIGIVMAAFAVGGAVLSSLLAGPIRATDPATSFGAIGIGVVAIGAALAATLRCVSGLSLATERPPTAPTLLARLASGPFIRLALAFFAICYVGLMVVSHATGMLAAQGVARAVVGLAPAGFTGGYIIGALFGGKLVEALSGARALVLANALSGLGLLVLLLPTGGLMILGMVMVGLVFGGSASLMPVLISEQYGEAHVGECYGKLMLAYGAAGLVAPWLSGALYVWSGNYALSLMLGLSLCALGITLGFGMRAALPSVPARKSAD